MHAVELSGGTSVAGQAYGYADHGPIERCGPSDHIAALRRWGAALVVEPGAHDATLRVADSLCALDEMEYAAHGYQTAAWSAARAGYPLRATVAGLRLRAISGSDRGILRAVAQVFSADSRLVGRVGSRISPSVAGHSQAMQPLSGTDREIIRAARGIARQSPRDLPVSQFPPTPLVSDLPSDEIHGVLTACKLRRYATGASVDLDLPSLLARGRVSFVFGGRRTGAAAEGCLLGNERLVGVVSPGPTAIADDDVDLLELPSRWIEQSWRSCKHSALERTFRRALVACLERSSPLLRGLPPSQRSRLFKWTTPCTFRDGQAISNRGSPSGGLFMVLSGRVRVSSANRPGAAMRFGAGDVIGLSTCFGGLATASAVAAGMVHCVSLTIPNVHKLLHAFPELARELRAEELRHRARIAPAA